MGKRNGFSGWSEMKFDIGKCIRSADSEVFQKRYLVVVEPLDTGEIWLLMSIGSTRVQQAAVASETGRAFSVVGVRRADGLSYLDEPLTHIFALNPNIDRDLGYRSCDNALSFRRTGPSVVSLT